MRRNQKKKKKKYHPSLPQTLKDRYGKSFSHPRSPGSHVLFVVPLKACCVRRRHRRAASSPAVYRTNLPTMTPTAKKSTMRATARMLRPSCFLMATEECGDDIMLLFLIRRPSSSLWGVQWKREAGRHKVQKWR